MRRFARLLALRYDMVRTRHSYYRELRLVHEPFQTDPAGLSGEHLRDYILHVKTVKHWKPKTVRQTAAAARLFFVDLMEGGNGRSSHKSRRRITGNCLP